jgi:hypothetical protein
VLDSGFGAGDGVYDVIRTFRHKPFRLPSHGRSKQISPPRWPELLILIPPKSASLLAQFRAFEKSRYQSKRRWRHDRRTASGHQATVAILVNAIASTLKATPGLLSQRKKHC